MYFGHCSAFCVHVFAIVLEFFAVAKCDIFHENSRIIIQHGPQKS
jgi:hypothetical protein